MEAVHEVPLASLGGYTARYSVRPIEPRGRCRALDLLSGLVDWFKAADYFIALPRVVPPLAALVGARPPSELVASTGARDPRNNSGSSGRSEVRSDRSVQYLADLTGHHHNCSAD
jgi:hypothetical protein